MSKYWSGAMGEKTTALQVRKIENNATKIVSHTVSKKQKNIFKTYQGSQALQDVPARFVSLGGGGITLRASAMGIISYDFSGQVGKIILQSPKSVSHQKDLIFKKFL